jgi:hypothetical protein
MSRPKLNLRDLFWLVALAALSLAWYQDRQASRRALYEVKYDLLQSRQSSLHVSLMGSSYLRPPGQLTKAARPTLSEAEIDAGLQLINEWRGTIESPYINDP